MRTRFIVASALLACLAVLLSCTSMTAPVEPRANPCTTGTPPSPAIVCIDDSDLTVKPPASPTEVHGKRGGSIQWFTVSGQGSIGILLEEPDVLREVKCHHNGHCIAVVSPNAKFETPYKYTIVLQKGGVVSPPHDPIIIIKP